MKNFEAAAFAESAGSHHALSIVPGVLVILAVCFNAILAFANAHVARLNPAWVMSIEFLLVLSAHVVALANYRAEMFPWYALAGLLILIACGRALYLQEFDPKYLRDVLLIPTFVVLGMTFTARGLNRLVLLIHAIVMIVLVLEAVNTDLYSSIFQVQNYYIDTRGYVVGDFWNKQSDLFVSATRPDSRLFSFIDLHRLSSIFLEPVSLGNYSIIIVAYTCARFDSLSVATKSFLLSGAALAVLGSDGRLAAVTSVLIIIVSMFATRLPRLSSIAYLPAVLAFALVLVEATHAQPGEDNFSGRIAHTIDLFGRFSVGDFLGLSTDPVLLTEAVDSGLGYLVMTQSLLGPCAILLFIAVFVPERTFEQMRIKHAVCLYLSFTMMVSFAFLTIKTAALLWFVVGAISKEAVVRSAPQTLSRTRASETRAVFASR